MLSLEVKYKKSAKREDKFLRNFVSSPFEDMNSVLIYWEKVVDHSKVKRARVINETNDVIAVLK
jgi:hypothetical protein